jgi:NitT/TauT family transport system substrate-binding protein
MRKTVSSLLYLLGASAITSGPFVMPAVAATPEVHIGTSAWIGYAPFYVAAEKDLFSKYGVKVTLQDFDDPAQIPAALESKGIVGAMYTYDQVITLAANGHAYKVVMPIDYSNGADAILAPNSIKSLSDLKGKTVAYPFATCDNLLVVYALKTAGLTEKDIQGVDTTPENVPAALVAGASAGATYEPNVTKVLALKDNGGFHALYTSRSAPGLIEDVLYFRQDFITENPKLITAIIHGYLDGMTYIHEHPDESNTIVGKHLASTADEVKAQFDGVHNFPLEEMPKSYVDAPNPQSLYVSGRLINEILVGRKQIPKGASIPETLDTSFVTQLTKK